MNEQLECAFNEGYNKGVKEYRKEVERIIKDIDDEYSRDTKKSVVAHGRYTLHRLLKRLKE